MHAAFRPELLPRRIADLSPRPVRLLRMCGAHADAVGYQPPDLSAVAGAADLLDGDRLRLPRRVPCGLLLRHGYADAIGHSDLDGDMHPALGAAAHLRAGRIDTM